ncbi:Grx4 family monothiol glutaredoxin [Laribacter hongkongensis]|uniref:Grx4 family monothiol glutaredoxin n=1 Tax=Laribacter hongkongensis TaxID=168471 RepID=UPI001EFEDEFD|nr:Grx4 family monothiol glutaredoxin [Laribacter hongkongensis]MCG9056405.1 Grx4 family monothiol glutaredoxin [Laribacter hongkongensis]
MRDVTAEIRQQITDNPVVLYMKGSAQFPQCGFSARAVQILKACGIDRPVTFNVLEDPDIRQGIKDFSGWPTIPQLYIKGEFIGGSDIMTEMFQSGELQPLVAEALAGH